MADQALSLLDISKRTGTDAAVGLVEEVTTYAPEFSSILGRAIPGTTYKARVRTALTGNSAFRSANEGLNVGRSTYEQKRFDTYFFDAQFQVDEAVLRSAGDGDSAEMILADEAAGGLRQAAIGFGLQFYKGTTNDAKGHPGLLDFLNTTDLVVDATGSGGTSYRAWFIQASLQGVHFLFGNNAGLQMGDWTRQKVLDASSKSYFALVNNISGHIGLSSAHKMAVGCVKNCTTAAPFTDTLAAKLLSQFPVGFKPNLCLINRPTAYQLQKSRSFTSVTNAIAGKRDNSGFDVFAPEPTSVCGVPIIVTDSIAAEAAS